MTLVKLKRTENGALGYESSGSALVDMFFKGISYRNEPEDVIFKDYAKAWEEDPLSALKLAFFFGDIREGMGERRLFNACLEWLAAKQPETLLKNIQLIPEFSRWDLVVNLACSFSGKDMVGLGALQIIKSQLEADEGRYAWDRNKPVSLLAKWMPSVNASSKKTKEKAKRLVKLLGLNQEEYRKMLSRLRERIRLVETQMTENKWNEIDYSKVPSKANLKYSKAFIRHDLDRRIQHLRQALNGKKKINANAVFPYEIYKMMRESLESKANEDTEERILSAEAAWSALPLEGISPALCVLDTSGSMTCEIVGSAEREDAAASLALLMSSRLQGPFKDKLVLFSKSPKYIDLTKCQTLQQKVSALNALEVNENTDIWKVFHLLLETAKESNLGQDQIPERVIIFSDMEFDEHFSYTFFGIDEEKITSMKKSLFSRIKQEWDEAGLKIPKLVFWNIGNASGAIPMRKSPEGVILMSGFSQILASTALSGADTPKDALMEKLNSERYEDIVL